MAQNSKIEWTHHTANLWHGCTKVHEGCDHCYAETLSHRWGRDIWGNDKPRMEIKSVWNDLARYQILAKEAGEIHRVFVGSMMDIAEKPMPLIDSKGNQRSYTTEALRTRLFKQIDNGHYPNLLFLFLSKRPGNYNKYIPVGWKTNPPANVMFGTSPVNQETANKLVYQLMKVNGKRFLSCEPLLGTIDLTRIEAQDETLDVINKIGFAVGGAVGDLVSGIDWVIVGGESGHGARPMHPEWVRSIRDQCKTAGVPFLFKQWGEYYTSSFQLGTNEPHFRMFASHQHWVNKAQTWVRGGKCISIDERGCKIGKDFQECAYPVAIMDRVGNKAAGRMLDGKIYNEFPQTSNSLI
jgi:protein gp37